MSFIFAVDGMFTPDEIRYWKFSIAVDYIVYGKTAAMIVDVFCASFLGFLSGVSRKILFYDSISYISFLILTLRGQNKIGIADFFPDLKLFN
jgi:hypothetical protein